jgi:hypothetical protein
MNDDLQGKLTALLIREIADAPNRHEAFVYGAILHALHQGKDIKALGTPTKQPLLNSEQKLFLWMIAAALICALSFLYVLTR